MQDVRLALKRLAQRPARTFASLVTLACGIAAATVTWSLVSATVLHPLPIRALDRWVMVHAGTEGGIQRREFVYPALPLIRDAAIFDRVVAAWIPLERLVLTIDGVGRRVRVGFVTGDYFSSFELASQVGRTLAPADDRRGAAPVAVLTDRFWRLEFQGRSDVLGLTAQVGAAHATIVGVAPAGFRGLDLAEAPDLYLPLSVIADVASPETNYFAEPGHQSAPTAGVRLFGRLHDGESPSQAEARLAALEVSLPPFDAASLGTTPLAAAALTRSAREDVVAFSRMLMAAVASMLILGGASTGFGLLLAIEARRREFATCLALGARVGTLVRGVAVEAAIVSGMAALLALPIAQGMLLGLRATSLPGGVSVEMLAPRIDARAMLACLLTAAVVFVVLTGAITLYASRRLTSWTTLALTTHGVSGNRHGAGTALLAVQVSVALVLLSGAALFVRSLQAALNVNDPRLATARLLTTELDLSAQHFDTARSASFFEEWRRRMEATPAIAAVAYSLDEGGMGTRGRLAVDGEPRSFPAIVRFKAVDAAYFRTVGLPVIEGRELVTGDAAGSPLVALASASLARLIERSGSAVGHTVTIPPGSPPRITTIVGVVPDLVIDVEALHPLTLYVPIAQRSLGAVRTVTLRAAADTDAARRAAVGAARSIDPAVAPPHLPTLRDEIRRQMAPQHLASAVLGVLGVLSLLLTVVATYVLAESLAHARTREIGVRVALGATRWRVVVLLLASTARPLATGVAIGAGVVWAGAGTLGALLFQIQATDASTLALVIALLTAVVVVASLGPALRAARSDVAGVLREG